MQKTPPMEAGTSMGGLSVLYPDDQSDGCCCLFVTVQPFADVVANYTCDDGDKKGEYVLQNAHLPPLEGVAAF